MTGSKVSLTTIFCAMCALAAMNAAADECSGGPNGGMGASGNDCSDPVAYTVSAPAQAATPVAAPTATKTFSRPPLEQVAHPQRRATRHRTHANGSLLQVPTSDVQH